MEKIIGLQKNTGKVQSLLENLDESIIYSNQISDS